MPPATRRHRLDREIALALDHHRRHRAGGRPRGRSALAARPAIYRAIGADGDAWPAWLRQLGNTGGVYAIRAIGGRPLYVGSAASDLYATITRHFQRWHRDKQWWKGMRGEGHDPGLVYARARHEVAVWPTPRGKHLELEGVMIRALRPRDNLVAHPAGEPAETDDPPF